MDSDELASWLRLLHSPGATRAGVRRLLRAFGGPFGALRAPDAARRRHVSAEFADGLLAVPADHAERLSRTLGWLDAARPGLPRRVLTLGDPEFPPALLAAPDPPLLLYVEGDVHALSSSSVAIVGSRRATPQGRDLAHRFAKDLCGRGLAVVSGLAVGIDAAAHLGALAAGGPTVAVVGTGLDRMFPPDHADLAEQVSRCGCVVSELALTSPPLPLHFPLRNRIIAGLSLGTLVVEAAPKSGSLITARLALDAGREVFAVPGSILAEQSKGCHQLLRQGATLVTSVDEVLDELGPAWASRLASARAPAGQPARQDAARSDPLLEALGHGPVGLDELAARTGLAAAALSARLLSLELDGQVARLAGGLLQRRSAG